MILFRKRLAMRKPRKSQPWDDVLRRVSRRALAECHLPRRIGVYLFRHEDGRLVVTICEDVDKVTPPG